MAEEGTTPILYVIPAGRHCIPTMDYSFSNIKPNEIVIPPSPKNNNTLPAKQQQSEDPTPEDPSPLRPGEI